MSAVISHKYDDERLDMSPEQIEQLAYRDLVNFSWELSNSISSATAYAQFLCEIYYDYFYVPETGTFFTVEKDGNYYHGYTTIVKKCSKADVLAAATKQLTYAQNASLEKDIINYWEEICSFINKC